MYTSMRIGYIKVCFYNIDVTKQSDWKYFVDILLVSTVIVSTLWNTSCMIYALYLLFYSASASYTHKQRVRRM